jgi:hypothetical protein
MIKKTAVLTKDVEKNMGDTKGLLNSLVVSNTDSIDAKITIRTESIVLWHCILPANSTIRISLDIILDELIYCISDAQDTNIILNIIETL